MVVRSATGDAAQATAALRRTLQRLDPDVPPRFSSMEARVVESVAERRFTLYLLGAFAGVALVLAFVGIYGVVSYSVARHTREIGIRLALGAEPGAVRKTVLAGAMGMVAVGLVVGVVAAVASTRVLTSLLYGISPTDPVTLVTVTVLLVGAAWLAALVPAQRSTRIDPLDAMRTD
jgi:putative ABC transport system permease protein